MAAAYDLGPVTPSVGDDLTFEETDAPAPSDAAVVDGGLHAFNQASADLAGIRSLACFVRSPAGDVVAGAVGRYWGTAAELQQLWVRDDLRRGGLGSRVVRSFEALARRKGCDLLYLDTFTFQAPDFYRKLGYAVACTLPGFPAGASKFLLTKSLAPAQAPEKRSR
jgi:GNAT superfamily N-acetyltransferase